LVIALVAAVATTANAQPPTQETITTTLSFPTFPSHAPFSGTYTGSFTAYSASGDVLDSGTVSAQARFGALPSPSTGELETDRSLIGSSGTLELRCSEIAKAVSGSYVTGSCVVRDATGVYSGRAASGKLIGTVDLGASPPTLTDTLAL
jgi:hypothetical protein